jgi:hypothetical protein
MSQGQEKRAKKESVSQKDKGYILALGKEQDRKEPQNSSNTLGRGQGHQHSHESRPLYLYRNQLLGAIGGHVTGKPPSIYCSLKHCCGSALGYRIRYFCDRLGSGCGIICQKPGSGKNITESLAGSHLSN